MQVFYTPPENIREEELVLSGEEAHHVQKVLRLGKGAPLVVVDGRGNAYKAEIKALAPREVLCTVFARVRNMGESLKSVTLAAGLSTGVKFDEVIQRATELGVTRFIPLITEKSKVKIAGEDEQGKKLERWKKVAVASLKQSGRSVLPEITPIIDFNRALDSFPNLGRQFLFDPAGERTLDNIRFDESERYFTIYVGPESGFARAELQLATERGVEIISLGQRILRTENAGPVATALLMYLLKEFK